MARARVGARRESTRLLERRGERCALRLRREGCARWVGGARVVEGSAARAMHPNSKHGHSECRKPAAASIAIVRVGRLLPLAGASQQQDEPLPLGQLPAQLRLVR
eukprot:scaffold32402_cov47-Phaeocystis_antarctica.AAC.4